MTKTALITELTETTFGEYLAHSDLPVLVDWWSADCQPCELIHPLIEDVAERLHGSILVAGVQIDANETLAPEYGLQSSPTLVLYRRGAEVGRVTVQEIVGRANRELDGRGEAKIAWFLDEVQRQVEALLSSI